MPFPAGPGAHFKQVPPPPCRADHTRVKQSEIDNPFVTLVSRRGLPQRLSGPSSFFVCLRGLLFFLLFQISPPLPCRADHSRKKLPILVEDEPRINPKTDGPPLLRRRHGMKPTRERGRPARTSPGTASGVSSTRLDRQRRQDPAWAGPMPFPPAGWPGAPSQGN